MRRSLFMATGVALLTMVTVTTTAASAATSGALTVNTVARNGATVTGTVAVYGINNTQQYTLTSGKAKSVANGTYAVMADISHGAAAETLDVQVVTVSGAAKTVTLDARQGQPFTVSLDSAPGADYTQSFDVRVCSQGQTFGRIEAWGFAGGLYVVPNSSSDLRLGYESAWMPPTTSADAFAVSGVLTTVRNPPVVKRSSMATVNAQLRSGPAGGSDVEFSLQPRGTHSTVDCDSELDALIAGGPPPYQQTVHVSPGTWDLRSDEFGVDNAGQSDDIGAWSLTKTLTSGQTYPAVFYHAGWGPRRSLPLMFNGNLNFDTSNMIEDPGVYGFEASVRSTSTLSLSGAVLSTQTTTPWAGANPFFVYKITKSGWYTLSVNTSRYRPGWTWPAGMLSPKTSAKFVWHQTPATATSVAPVFLSRFNPAGLDRFNQGQPGSTQQVPIILERPDQGEGTVTPDTVKNVTAYASYDHGVTWHALAVTRTPTSITAAVPNPASGTVSLRVSVNDPNGNYSTITVYDAYKIA
jgi:hypothetical protein